MEEIITVDGRQFKLTVDRPLTAQEKAQVLAEIRKQTGCGTCGPRVANLRAGWGNDAMIFSMTPTCTRTTYSSGDTITMEAAPMTGIGPYTVTFYYDKGAGDTQVGSTQTAVAEATSTTAPTATQALTITDTIAAGAAYGGTAGNIRLKVSIADSCPTGAQTCSETCVISAVCVPPTCNFIVT